MFSFECFSQEETYEAKITEFLINECGCSFDDTEVKSEEVIEKIEKYTFGKNSRNVEDILKKINKASINELQQLLKKEDFGFFEDSENYFSKNNQSTKKTNIICLLTLKMHLYYISIDDPKKLTQVQKNFYKEIKSEEKKVKPEYNNNEEKKVALEKNHEHEKVKVLEINMFYYKIIILLQFLTITALLFYLNFSRKRKKKNIVEVKYETVLQNDKKHTDLIDDLNLKIKAKDIEISKLSDIIEALNNDIHNLKRIKTKVAPVIEQTYEVSPVIKEVKYLQEPSDSGVFYRNSIKDAKNHNTLYTIEIASSNPNEALIFLLKESAVISRAESMPQQLLLPVCELNGKGDININTLKIEPGIVVKENDTWKVTKKIVLTW